MKDEIENNKAIAEQIKVIKAKLHAQNALLEEAKKAIEAANARLKNKEVKGL